MNTNFFKGSPHDTLIGDFGLSSGNSSSNSCIITDDQERASCHVNDSPKREKKFFHEESLPDTFTWNFVQNFQNTTESSIIGDNQGNTQEQTSYTNL